MKQINPRSLNALKLIQTPLGLVCVLYAFDAGNCSFQLNNGPLWTVYHYPVGMPEWLRCTIMIVGCVLAVSPFPELRKKHTLEKD